MSDIQILSGIPVPRGRRGPKSRYPWGDLSVNDSFFLSSEDAPSVAALKQSAKKAGVKIAVERDYEHEGRTGVMVWRVE